MGMNNTLTPQTVRAIRAAKSAQPEEIEALAQAWLNNEQARLIREAVEREQLKESLAKCANTAAWVREELAK
jgi:hypothetical protein